MNNLRKLIRESIQEAIISETAIALSEIIKNPGLGLVTTKIGNGIQLDLFDFIKGRMLGTIECVHVGDNIFDVVGVAAENGYGTFMHESVMMIIYDNVLTATRNGDIRDKAWRIWKKLYDRSDVKKIPIDIRSKAYSDVYTEDKYGSDYIIGNMSFMMAPSSEFENLIERTPILVKMYKINKDEIRRKGGDFFAYKYSED